MRVSSQQQWLQLATYFKDRRASLGRLQEQLATGQTVQSPSDNPRLFQEQQVLGDRLARLEQWGKNREVASERLAVTSKVLEALRGQIETAKNAMVMNDPSSPYPAELHETLRATETLVLAFANETGADGLPVFGGTAAPVETFTRSPAGGMLYAGNSGIQNIEIASHGLIQTNTPGDEAFMHFLDGPAGISAEAGSGNTGTMVLGTLTSAALASPQENYTGVWDGSAWQVTDNTTGATTPGTGSPVVWGTYALTYSGSPAVGDSFTVKGGVVFNVFEVLSRARAITKEPASTAKTNEWAVLTRRLFQVGEQWSLLQARTDSTRAQLTTLATVQQQEFGSLTRVRDALTSIDPAEVAIKLQQERLSLEALYAAVAKTKDLSLFNVLA